MTRPAQLEQGLEDRSSIAPTAALAAQQISIQAIYLILPGLVGQRFGLLDLDLLNFVALSVASIAIVGLLQVMTHGPVGSGYPIASIPSPVFVAVYLAAAPAVPLGVVGAATLASGLIGLLLAGQLRQLQRFVPTEVAGVVVLLIGVTLLPHAFEAAEMRNSGLADPALAFATLGVMVAIALKGGRMARFAVLYGLLLGSLAAIPLGIGIGDVGLVRGAPWLALPRLAFPTITEFNFGLLPPLLAAMLASFASWTGDLVAFQRAADGAWRRPDTPPIRRGLLAQCLA